MKAQTEGGDFDLGEEDVLVSIDNILPEVTSTFDKIREYPLSHGLTVVSSRQTAGSGRLGRKWESPEGGIYFTFCLKPPFDIPVPSITLVCAAGVHKALSKYAECSVKWPNDIVSDGKKICGILTRNIVSGGKVEAILFLIELKGLNGRAKLEGYNVKSIIEYDGNGKITFEPGSSNVGYIFDVEGQLILDSGIIELTGEWSIGYCVDIRPNAWGLHILP